MLRAQVSKQQVLSGTAKTTTLTAFPSIKKFPEKPDTMMHTYTPRTLEAEEEEGAVMWVGS
jgi:NADPH-dependent ferric siderophore reductase